MKKNTVMLFFSAIVTLCLCTSCLYLGLAAIGAAASDITNDDRYDDRQSEDVNEKEEGAFLTPPSFTFDVMTYFNKEMFELFNFMGSEWHTSGRKNEYGNYFLTLYGSFFYDQYKSDYYNTYYRHIEGFSDYYENDTHNRLNFLTAVNLRFGPFFLSLFTSATNGNLTYVQDPEERYLLGPYLGQRGLVYTAKQKNTFSGFGAAYKSDLIYIGAYAGKMSYESSIEYDTMDDKDFVWSLHDIRTYNVVVRETEEDSDSFWSFSIIPIYYPKKFEFIERIAALLDINVYRPSEFFLDIPLRRINTTGGRAMSMGFYYNHERYDPLAYNNIYGIRAWAYLLPNKNNIKITLDMGYQQFVDIKNDWNEFYANTFYFKPNFQFNYRYFNFWIEPFFDNKNFPAPALNFSIGIITNRYILPTSFRFNPWNKNEEYSRAMDIGGGGKLLLGLFPY